MSKTASTQDLHKDKVQAFQAKVLEDVAGFVSIACGSIGDKIGLYKALAESGPVTPKELAEITGAKERYVLEWLINQAASQYVEYDPNSGKFSMSAENAAVLADEHSPYFAGGFFEVFSGFGQAVPNITECFKTGRGMLWGDHAPSVFSGTERVFRPSYTYELIPQWIPAIPGLKEKLEKGIKVADVGCGHGLSTIILAKEFPNSTFFGFDNHAPSITRANEAAQHEGVFDRVKFECTDAGAFTGSDYDLVAYFDCLHDMGDPVASCKRAVETLKPDGCAMIIEPMGGAKIEDNFNLVGRVFSGASVMCCTPNAVASGNHSLGTIATDEALEEVVKAGGFSTFRRVVATPFNRVFEAKV